MRSGNSRILLALLTLATLALGFAPDGAWAVAGGEGRAASCAVEASASCCGTDEPCCCVEAPAVPSRVPAPTAPARSSEQAPTLALAAPEANRAAPPLAPEARAQTSPFASVDAALLGFAASPAERRLHLRQALLLD